MLKDLFKGCVVNLCSESQPPAALSVDLRPTLQGHDSAQMRRVPSYRYAYIYQSGLQTTRGFLSIVTTRPFPYFRKINEEIAVGSRMYICLTS